MVQRATCLFMLGVVDGDARLRKTDAFIDVSAFPQRQLDAHNNLLLCPRERRAHVGKWTLCVVIRVPADRGLDTAALKMFWRRRSRTLEKRVCFGVQMARALRLECYVARAHMHLVNADASVQRTDGAATLVGPPLCRVTESICFAIGSADALALARGAERRPVGAGGSGGEGGEPADDGDGVDWTRLAHLAVEEPAALLDPIAQTIQANELELMLHAADPAERAAGAAVLANAQRCAAGSALARADTGAAPFQQLRDAVGAACRNAAGEIDDALLVAHGDECYADVNEYWTRPLERLRLHRVQRCVCGARGTLTQRARVTTGGRGGTSRIGLVCAACGRTSVASVLLAPSVGALRRRVALPARGDGAALRIYDATCDVPAVALDAREPTPGPPIGDTDAAVERALRKRRRD